MNKCIFLASFTLIGAFALFLSASLLVGSSWTTEREATLITDTSLYAELVRFVDENGLWKGPSRNHTFDPRWVRNARGPFHIGAEDVIAPTEQVLEVRIRTLERLNAPQTNILEDMQCALSGGLAPPNQHGGAADSTRSACRAKGSFVSVIFSRPRSFSTCPRLDSLRSTTNKCVVVDAIEMSENSFYEYELFVVHTPDVGWHVTEARMISGVSS